MRNTPYNRKNFYTDKARELGYPARSVFKLEEIDKKLKLIKVGFKVLDLGAAPGSWSIYAAKKIGPQGKIIAIDLSPLKIQLKNVFFYQQDLFDVDEKFLAQIKERHGIDRFDLVLSDAAPATSGIRNTDAVRSLELVEQAFAIAKMCLKNKGNFVVKVFESNEINDLLKEAQKYFGRFMRFRPQAVRKISKEFYLVGAKFKKETTKLNA